MKIRIMRNDRDGKEVFYISNDRKKLMSVGISAGETIQAGNPAAPFDICLTNAGGIGTHLTMMSPLTANASSSLRPSDGRHLDYLPSTSFSIGPNWLNARR